ncbi:MAG TPA: DUF938 domain-containing protein [Steroidobacter sp.]|jgi:SAM-dependent methyltransferase|nr:DUF938 domain-containing protein [Steroidobacteraceae bacterium]HLS82426.1 DUF938 domain-containing protein [Steroidobacter sp.]
MSGPKPYSPAFERNRDPILAVLRQWFTEPGEVLEIGCGSGQHAVYFASRLPHLIWICTDLEESLADAALRLKEANLPNLRGPLRLDVREDVWPVSQARYVFSANTAHIMSWPAVDRMFAGVGRILKPDGVFCLYGPFNREGAYTSESNREFDLALRALDPDSGLRDDRELSECAARYGLDLVEDHAMPANNRTLVWKRVADSR